MNFPAIARLSFTEKLGVALAAGIRNIPQLRALLHLHEFGPMSMTALRPACRVSAPAMTCLVDRLEKAGYLARIHGQDRREIIIGLTQAGRELAADLTD